MDEISKEELIENIKKLISIDGSESIDINPNYLEYFQLEELIEIYDTLKIKKDNQKNTLGNYLDELYEKCK